MGDETRTSLNEGLHYGHGQGEIEGTKGYVMYDFPNDHLYTVADETCSNWSEGDSVEDEDKLDELEHLTTILATSNRIIRVRRKISEIELCNLVEACVRQRYQWKPNLAGRVKKCSD